MGPDAALWFALVASGAAVFAGLSLIDAGVRKADWVAGAAIATAGFMAGAALAIVAACR